MTLSNWKMIAEPRSYSFRWRSRFRRRHVCFSSLLMARWSTQQPFENQQKNYCGEALKAKKRTYVFFAEMKAEMFWFKNLRIKGIQLANTRCWLINSNCRYKQREIFPGKKLMATGKRLAGFEKDRQSCFCVRRLFVRKALKGNFRSSSAVFKVMTSWNLILDSLPSKTRISSEFCPEKLFRSKLEGFLENMAFKLKDIGKSFQMSFLFHPCHPEI